MHGTIIPYGSLPTHNQSMVNAHVFMFWKPSFRGRTLAIHAASQAEKCREARREVGSHGEGQKEVER